MAFQQGLSGLNSSAKALDVISNNVANASTVGFKASNTIFADMYATAMTGGVSSLQIGIGSRVAAVTQSFTQGNVTATNNPLDMAINGNGFFRLERSDGTVAYSRNGQFDVSRDGFIINATGDRLTGYAAIDSNVTPTVFAGEPTAIYIDTSNIQPRETTTGSLGVNLDSKLRNPLNQDPVGTDITNFLATGISNPVSIPVDAYNYTTTMTVYDSLGNASLLNLYFVRNPNDPLTGVAPNTWSVYGRLSNDVVPDPLNPAESTGEPLERLGSIEFNAFGVPVASFEADGVTPTAQLGQFGFSRTAAQLQTGADDFDMTLDLKASTQWNTSSAVTTAPRQDGYTTGSLTGLSVSSNGIVQGTFSNGQVKDLAMLTLANFSSPQGLTSLGNNLWAESYDSGQAILGSPGTGVLGVVSSGQIEESNVDLTQELVNMIIQQRNYQANAQSIKTQDSILQTIVNIR